MQEIPPQEYDTWAITMLRFTKDERTQARNARTPNPEHECKICGKPFLSKTGMKVHQKLAPECAAKTEQQSQNTNACPNNNCNFKHHDPRQLRTHLFYHCHQKNILRELNSLTNNARKNRTRMIHTGVPKENMTCLNNNMTYSAGTQKWVCDICSKTEQPQDIQNMIRHILWHIRKQQKQIKKTQSKIRKNP